MLNFSKYRQIIFSCQYNNGSLFVINAIDQEVEKEGRHVYWGGGGIHSYVCMQKKNIDVVF